MQTIFSILRLSCLTAALMAMNGIAAEKIVTSQKVVTATANSRITVQTVNGQSVVTFNGREVYSGPLQGTVSSKSKRVNGQDFSVVFDGDKVLWESAPGAAEQVRAADDAAIPAQPQRPEVVRQEIVTSRSFKNKGGASGTGSGMSAGGGSGGGSSFTSSSSFSSSSSGSGSLAVRQVDGKTVVVFNGNEFEIGATTGRVSSKTKSINGETYAVVFDGDRVVWENVPGAAEHLK